MGGGLGPVMRPVGLGGQFTVSAGWRRCGWSGASDMWRFGADGTTGFLNYFPRVIKNRGPSLSLRLSTATRTLVSRPFP